jgi:hypothetical protein
MAAEILLADHGFFDDHPLSAVLELHDAVTEEADSLVGRVLA